MCYTPFYIKKETGGVIPVPCGKCKPCRGRRLNGWAFRLLEEEKICNSANFITLTYGTTHIPITERGSLSLCKRDVQLFIKRLRKKHDGANIVGSIKYYAVGEYGSTTVRPHYHILLFNAKIEFISDAWGLGHVHYGKVTPASIRYTLDYMSKPKTVPAFDGDDREPEFSLMSKRLGASYLSEKMINWHHEDMLNRSYCNLLDGKKVAMPRYYKERIYKWWDRNMIVENVLKKMDEKIRKSEVRDVNFHRNKGESIKRDFRVMKKNKKVVL